MDMTHDRGGTEDQLRWSISGTGQLVIHMEGNKKKLNSYFAL